VSPMGICSESSAKLGIPCNLIRPVPLISRRLLCLFYKLKAVIKETRFEVVLSIQQTVRLELKTIMEEEFSRAFGSLYE
jgi:hypothetical protein